MATSSQPQSSGLFALKSMAILQEEAGAEGADTLKRSLGALNLTLLGIGGWGLTTLRPGD